MSAYFSTNLVVMLLFRPQHFCEVSGAQAQAEFFCWTMCSWRLIDMVATPECAAMHGLYRQISRPDSGLITSKIDMITAKQALSASIDAVYSVTVRGPH